MAVTSRQIHLTIERKIPSPASTIGELRIDGTKICDTLELPWLWNENSMSCIPNGTYTALVRTDKSDGWRLQLAGVLGRSGIQIHMGNYPRHTTGCILLGTHKGGDQLVDSAKAYWEFYCALHPQPSMILVGGARVNPVMQKFQSHGNELLKLNDPYGPRKPRDMSIKITFTGVMATSPRAGRPV